MQGVVDEPVRFMCVRAYMQGVVDEPVRFMRV